jgi:putative peptide zinc metalloprotease protein
MDNEVRYTSPELSEDIEFNVLSKGEYILSNVKHRHYVKVNQSTYDLLALVDGKKDVNEICASYNQKYDQSITGDILGKLLYKELAKYGVLKGHDHQIKEYQKPSYLKLSFVIINPKSLSKVTRLFYFLFNRKLAILLIPICIAIVGVLLFQNIELYKSFNLQQSLIYFFIVMIASVTFHEIGHATSASYFGAKHGGIGAGFYLFSPVYYADVTDIWRLKKWQRIVVNLSGIYFELIFCSILAIISVLSGNYVLLIISITVCLHTLVNLNPFLRSDGYWVVSDLTNKPNLLHHSISKTKDLYNILRGHKIKWKAMDVFLFLYGIISYGLIGVFLYFVLFKNHNAVLNFPNNLITFVRGVFNADSEINLVKYVELVIPLIFYLLLFRLLRSSAKAGIAKIKATFK